MTRNAGCGEWGEPGKKKPDYVKVIGHAWYAVSHPVQPPDAAYRRSRNRMSGGVEEVMGETPSPRSDPIADFYMISKLDQLRESCRYLLR